MMQIALLASEGRDWADVEVRSHYYIASETIKLIRGKVFGTDEQRITEK